MNQTQSTFVVSGVKPPERYSPVNRLREAGVYHVSTPELLAVLMGQNDLTAANQLLQHYPTLTEIAHALLPDLQQIHGVGERTAMRLQSALELGKRLAQENARNRVRTSSPQDAAAQLAPVLANPEHERFGVLYLSTRNDVLCPPHVLYQGTVNSSLIRPAEVFRNAIRRNAVAIIVGHNHPSGDPQPSPEDIALTRKLIRAGKEIEVEVLDHIVVGTLTQWISLRERALGFEEA